MAERPDLTQARARKALGQHFLFDPDILKRTALAAGPVTGRTVIEVGPGPGGLTRALLDAGADSLTCVETDERFAGALRAWPEAQDGRLNIIENDARKIDWSALPTVAATSQPAMIVANLPYNVGTPLLVNWLKAGAWRGEMALMFQKEVAERACAKPGSRHYGRLAVLTAAVCDAHIAFTLPPGAFRPPPKVDSAVAVFAPLPAGARYGDLSSLEKVTTAAFGQRRKMMRASLKSLAKTVQLDAVHWLESCKIDPTSRAETLTQQDFRALADKFGETSHADNSGQR
ncbi:MAG: 16S rRNA (adenine(1518)-N(6)/adenine(1519)-N(6))-dimethyltransferase RsmA [Hyphomonadaceae bacterium]|nr:16S rRNA (adenine(1518)-N(6)/adenine(1519)-N(6))-dimethyltransferase RsmA [Hyphomonadaceae bacterium]